MLSIGNVAPLNIEVVDESGQKTSLSRVLGQPTVVYFYPKDNSPGCTKEACSFRDYNEELEKLGVQVIGVSGDSYQSHVKFAQKHHLNFKLWSDPEKKLINAFGAWGQKSMFGKTFLGIRRMTFALDETGKIIHIWPKVEANQHAQEVWGFFNQLMSSK